jgi:hypothetical protein
MALTWTRTPGRWRWRVVAPTIYKKIDEYERVGDKNCLEPVWKGHWKELRVDIITALTPALLLGVTLRCFARSNYEGWRCSIWPDRPGSLSLWVRSEDVGSGGPIRGPQPPLLTQSHALRRTSFCSTADKLVSQLASSPVGDLVSVSLSKVRLCAVCTRSRDRLASRRLLWAAVVGLRLTPPPPPPSGCP